jgi:hypothetical protein
MFITIVLALCGVSSANQLYVSSELVHEAKNYESPALIAQPEERRVTKTETTGAAEEYFYVAPGSSTSGVYREDTSSICILGTAVDIPEKLAAKPWLTEIMVQCCSSDSTKSYRKTKKEKSKVKLSCSVAKTHTEAMALCASVNLRLCTAKEQADDRGRHTGCGFDNLYGWTSTTCESQGAKKNHRKEYTNTHLDAKIEDSDILDDITDLATSAIVDVREKETALGVTYSDLIKDQDEDASEHEDDLNPITAIGELLNDLDEKHATLIEKAKHVSNDLEAQSENKLKVFEDEIDLYAIQFKQEIDDIILSVKTSDNRLSNICIDHDCSHAAQQGHCEASTATLADGMRTTSWRCVCENGFVGDECEHNFNECASGPCQNNGNCFDGIASHICVCPLGFEGDNCEINTNECEGFEEACLNDGTCIDGNNTYSCFCAKGFEGEHCQKDIDECSAAPCEHNGICKGKIIL